MPTRALPLAAAVCTLAICLNANAAPADQKPLQAAFATLLETLARAERVITESAAFGSDAEQAGGYRHLLRALMKGIEAEVLQDADYPYFRILDFWLKEGGDNPDQRYAFSPIRGGEPYRVWGTLGNATRVELQLYAGRPWDGTGTSVGYLNFEDIPIADDGSFEIWVTPDERPGAWLANPPEATTVFARHVYSSWGDAAAAEIHIDRLGYEGRRKPAQTTPELAARIRAAADMFHTTATTWPDFVQKRYVSSRPANAVIAPIDTYRFGGARGRWLSSGHFELADDQVLVIRMPKTAAPYQAIQLTDMWYASLEHGNQVSSLTADQSVLAPDGAYYYVVSTDDPGYPNWLDTGGLARGVHILRWDGLTDTLAQAQWPTATVLARTELHAHIPAYHEVTPAQRDAERAARRRHLQRRANR